MLGLPGEGKDRGRGARDVRVRVLRRLQRLDGTFRWQGAALAAMSGPGLLVPPGFTITSRACQACIVMLSL